MKVTKLVTVATLKEVIEMAIMEMEGYLVLENENTFKGGVLKAYVDKFKKDSTEAIEIVEEVGVPHKVLIDAYDETIEAVNKFEEMLTLDEDELENEFLNNIENAVVTHKNFNKFFFAVQSELIKGEKNVAELMKVVKKFAPDLAEFELNYAVCHVAEEIGIDMNTLDNYLF